MIDRSLTQHALEALSRVPVVLLTGARQSGTSTLIKTVSARSRRARYISLSDANALTDVRHDPAEFLAGMDGPAAIDEIHRAPELIPAIRRAVGRNRRPGQFLLAGSVNAPLPSRSFSPGLVEVLNLWPFSQGELEGIRESFIDRMFAARLRPMTSGEESPASLRARVVAGGFPEAVRIKNEARRSAWFESHITTVLQKDIRELAGIEGLAGLPKLLAIIAARAPALLNFADIARALAMPQSTLKRYMALLEAAFLIRRLPAWQGQQGKRLVKAPRLVMTDTGLMTHLLGVRSEQSAGTGFHGPLLENFVVMELLKQSAWSAATPRLFHFSTQTGRKVDIVLANPAGKLVGIAVRESATVTNQDFNGLRALAEAAGKRFFHRGIVIYTGAESIAFGKEFFALPVNALWSPGRK
jgi:hypothetical protein